jgi:hypothetical protein
MMKTTKMLTFLVVALGMMVWSASSASGAQYLMVNGKDVNSIILMTGQTCIFEVVSGTSTPYGDYFGFDNSLILGRWGNWEIKPEAGNLASITVVKAEEFSGLFIEAAGSAPPPSAGVHFVISYEAETPGETDLKLYQNSPPPSPGTLLDSVHITVVSATVGTGFTYQGRLIDDNEVADGLYDFEFALYDYPIDGNQIGTGTIDINDLDVIDGYFTVELNFGGGVFFDGAARWLDIGVRPGNSNDANDFVTLVPRQNLTPTPNAIYAQEAAHARGASLTLPYSETFSSSVPLFSMTNTNPNGTWPAIHGESQSLHSSASAVRGVITSTSPAPDSAGIRGINNGQADAGVGVWGSHAGNGYGVYGSASGETGRGVYGLTSGAQAHGVHGKATGSMGTGVYGEATGDVGYGVYGIATGSSPGGTAYGGYLTGDNDDTGNSYGLYSRAIGTGGANYGVYGYATGGTSNYAIYGNASGGPASVKYAGYFIGGKSKWKVTYSTYSYSCCKYWR